MSDSLASIFRFLVSVLGSGFRFQNLASNSGFGFRFQDLVPRSDSKVPESVESGTWCEVPALRSNRDLQPETGVWCWHLQHGSGSRFQNGFRKVVFYGYKNSAFVLFFENWLFMGTEIQPGFF